MALSANTRLNISHGGPESINQLPVLTNVNIYQGAGVGGSAGYARPLTAGDLFKGFAFHNQANNTGGASGAIDVSLVTTGVLLGVSVTGISSLALAQLNNVVYMSDDATFTSVIGSNSRIGKITRYDTVTGLCDVWFSAHSHTHGT